MDAEAVKEKYTGEEGNQNVFNTEYNVGIEGVFLLAGARDARCDRNASSTLGPAFATGLGAARDATNVDKNTSGLTRESSAQLSRSRLGSMWNAS